MATSEKEQFFHLVRGLDKMRAHRDWYYRLTVEQADAIKGEMERLLELEKRLKEDE